MAHDALEGERAIEKLNALIELEHDALSSRGAARGRLSDPQDRSQTAGFIATHQRHIAELCTLVLDRGGTPAARGDMSELLRRWKVELASLAGEEAILAAMKSNTDALTTAYLGATTEPTLGPRERAVVERALADERWHAAWLERRIGLTPDVGEAIMADEGENVRAERESRSSHP